MSICNEINKEIRIRGRASLRDDVNGIFPKFIITSENPLEYETILTQDEVDTYSSVQVFYEPVYYDLGILREIMYVPTPRGTYLFSLTADASVTWASAMVTFSSGLVFCVNEENTWGSMVTRFSTDINFYGSTQ